MNRILLISLSLLFVNTSLRAQETSALNLALKGIDLGTNLHYKESYEVFQKLIELEPENPRGYFLRSAIYFWMFSENVKNEEVGDKSHFLHH